MGGFRRVWVVGNSGSGKTTLARHLADRLGCPYIELDAHMHQPGWTELPADEFRRRVGKAVAGEQWVVDGNYSAVSDLIWPRADTLVWLDYPRSLVLRRLLRRTLSRSIRRTELWNGNREPLKNFLSLNKEKSILVWAWTQHGVYHQRYREEMLSGRWPEVRFVRLSSPRDVGRMLGRFR